MKTRHDSIRNFQKPDGISKVCPFVIMSQQFVFRFGPAFSHMSLAL
jgi:hypothetical protein